MVICDNYNVTVTTVYIYIYISIARSYIILIVVSMQGCWDSSKSKQKVVVVPDFEPNIVQQSCIATISESPPKKHFTRIGHLSALVGAVSLNNLVIAML